MRRVPPHLKLAALDVGIRTEQDLLRDYAEEIAGLHELPAHEVVPRFRRFMDVYHYRSEAGSPEEWEAILGGELEHSFIRISKPFRFVHQEVVPLVLRAIERYARTGADRLRVLDYGGGSGSDAIIYARSGHEAHYADLVAWKNTDVVARRFALRGLDIPIHDALGLPDRRFDVITAIDVIEHIYDVEEATARLAARVPAGGLLCCANAFSSITYDGDHLDKNRVYVELFPRLMETAGFERVTFWPPLEVFRRLQPPAESVQEETERLLDLLYAETHRLCADRCRSLLAVAARAEHEPLVGLPAADTVPSGAPAPTTASSDNGRSSLRERVVPLAGRLAPPFVRRRVWERRQEEMVEGMRRPTDARAALGSLIDYGSVLRIAEHRLRSRGLPLDGGH